MTIQEKAIEQLERISEHLSAIGEKEDYTDVAIKALEAQPNSNEFFNFDAPMVKKSEAVSREQVIEEIEFYQFNPQHFTYESLIDDIKNLPPVTPKYTDEEIDKAQAVEQAYVDKMVELAVKETERPKGKWIKIQSGNEDFPESIVCSRCKNENSHLDFDEHSEPIGKIFVTSKYCPNCGAEMSGGGEDGAETR